MIDIHAHILPGVDDGAVDLAAAIEMAQIAKMEGIEKIIATPHVIPGEFDLSKEDIIEAVKNLNYALKEKKIPLEVFPGAENYLDLDLVQRVKTGQVMTLNNGKYILVEAPMHSFPEYVEQVFFELKLLGITPILAHPERNRSLSENPKRVEGLVKKGVLLQINATSLIGAFGKTVATNANLFLEHNWVHFLATDCHSCGTRGPRLKEAFKIVAKMVGKDKADELVLTNSQRVIDGDDIIVDEIKEYTPNRGIWGKIKSKLF